MKKTVCLLLILLLCAALPGFADTDNLLARVYDANTGIALQSAYESRVIRVTKKDEADTAVYMGRYYEIEDSPDYFAGIRVRSSEYDYIALNEGGFGRFLTLEMEADPWQFYSDELFDMELISAEEDGDTLVVTVKPTENYATDYFPDAIETREVNVLDAGTLELKAFHALAVLPDGSEETFYEATIEFDVEPIHPEVIEAIEKHLYEEAQDTRTTTFIFDEDKPCKRTYSYETPVGDRCFISSFTERGYQYEIDQARSIPSNEALDNDAVYYLKRIVPEQESQDAD